MLVSPRCVDGDPNRKGRRRLGGACPPAAPRGWHRRPLPAGALGPQAHPGGRVELWLVESRVVGGWFSFLDVAVMLPCRLGGRVGRWGPNDHPPKGGDGLGGGRGRAGRGREGGSWARGSHCSHGSAVRGVRPGAGKHGTGVVCGRLHVVTAAGEHTGVEGCRQPRDTRVVFRERRWGRGDLGDGEPCPRGCVGVKRARETQPEWPGRGRVRRGACRVARGELWARWGRGVLRKQGSVGRTRPGEPLNVGSRPHVGSHVADSVPAPEPRRVAPGTWEPPVPVQAVPRAPGAPAAGPQPAALCGPLPGFLRVSRWRHLQA